MNYLQELGEIIRTARKMKKLSQEKLAELCGLCMRQISEIENGQSNPKFDTLVRLQKVLEIDAALFFGIEIPEKEDKNDVCVSRKNWVS